MKTDFKDLIIKVYNDDLDLESTRTAFSMIMNGEINDTQISAFVSLLQKSGIKAHHVIGALEIMRSKMIGIKSKVKSIDTCGTGGDGKNSLNISTATAFVLAAKGISVAKHGNKALTSKCGSADVLKALNIKVDMETSKLESCLSEIGMCFMFAPNHHPAMKFVGPVRQQLGIRTIFNILGPLLNPADVENQIVGVYSEEVFNIYKEVFDKDTKKNVCLVSGFNNNDEISLDGVNTIYTKNNGIFEFDPKILDIPKTNLSEISGGDADYNANRILEIFNGKIDSFFNTVCINSAFGIMLHESISINNDNILKIFDDTKNLMLSKKPIDVITSLSKFTNS